MKYECINSFCHPFIRHTYHKCWALKSYFYAAYIECFGHSHGIWRVSGAALTLTFFSFVSAPKNNIWVMFFSSMYLSSSCLV